jgi:peptide/nickel transport system permease protein
MPLRYIARRLIQLLPIVWIVATLVFFMFRVLPGDPASLVLGQENTVDPQKLAVLRTEMGLDRPLAVQYATWLSRAAVGDLGKSFRQGEPVARMMVPHILRSVELAGSALLLALLIAIPVGVIAAVRSGTWVDQAVRVVSLFGFSTPNYWMAILLMLLFSLKLRWLPAGGFERWDAGPMVHLKFLILPAVTVAGVSASVFIRFLRAGMLDVLSQDYIRTARAKGLSQAVVNYKHAMKNSLISMVTVVGTTFGDLLSGIFITEVIFAWPGLGKLTIDGIYNRDYSLVQGAVLYTALLFMLVNLVVDILYTFLDPRIQYS